MLQPTFLVQQLFLQLPWCDKLGVVWIYFIVHLRCPRQHEEHLRTATCANEIHDKNYIQFCISVSKMKTTFAVTVVAAWMPLIRGRYSLNSFSFIITVVDMMLRYFFSIELVTSV